MSKMKTKSTFFMRYKLLFVETMAAKDVSPLGKLAVLTVGVIFIMGEPDSSFLPKYYKRFPIKE